ncbi:uncharacterized protein DS421_1g04900 [Arachis hypogaea]|nr:uncharacterized protein DS421_1g04900 [Arachis hypogaea]
MMHHMFNYIKSDKNASLPYGIFLNYIFEFFGIDLSDEIMEDKLSYFKGGGATKQTKEKSIKDTKKPIFEEDEKESIPLSSTAGTFSSHKHLINGIVKDVL